MRNFLSIFENQTRLGTKIYVPDYLETGNYPIVDQSRKLICGYKNEPDGLYTNTPFIVFGDVTRTIKYIDFPCYLGADGSVILKVKDKNYSAKYLYYYLLHLHQYIPNAGYNRHYKYLKDLSFKQPTLDEQIMQVIVLDKLNELIKKCEIEIELYNELIKSRFNELFGDPLLNEYGFEIKELSKLVPFNSVKNAIVVNNNTWLLNLDMIESDTGRIIEKIRTSEIGDSTIEFDTTCVLYSKLRPYLNKVVIPDENGIGTSELISMRCDSNIITREYLAYSLRHKSFVNYINSKTGGAKMPRTNMNELRSFKIPIPPLELQEGFSSFVNQIDKLKFSNRNPNT